MTSSSVRMRQVMDISAAVWGGVVAGLVFLILQIIIAVGSDGGTIWLPFFWNSAIVLGQPILLPPVAFAFVPVIVGLLLHFLFSILFALLIAFIIHRGGLVLGIVGGGLVGLALYALNFYFLSSFMPWFYTIRGWEFAVAHFVFGAVVGGVYEGLEVEEFVPVEE